MQTSYYETLLGRKRRAFYLARFQRFDEEGAGPSWNWATFFFTALWFLYRKMWAWGGLLILASFCINVLVQVLEPVSPGAATALQVLFYVGWYLILPMYANALYHRHARRVIDEAMLLQEENERVEQIARRGGVSQAVLLVLLVPLIGILAAIAIPSYLSYITMAKVTTGIKEAEGYTQRVERHVRAQGVLPNSLEELGEGSWRVESPYVKSLDLERDGVIVVEVEGSTVQETLTLRLIPRRTADGGVSWHCASLDVEPRYFSGICGAGQSAPSGVGTIKN